MLSVVDLSPGYREWAPPVALRHVLACLWVQVTPDHAARASMVLPDGCTDLIWERGRGAFVAGPDTGPVPTLLPPGTVLAGARFRPGAGGAALGVPLTDLRDQRVGIADLRCELTVRLPAALEPGDAIATVTDVAGRLTMERPPDAAVLYACRLLAAPAARAEDVAAQIGLSPRQFRRRCEAAVGYGPKMLQRVLRFRRFVSLADKAGASADLAQAAVDAGYADQPHLTRETVQLAGLPPAALIRERRPRSL
jgi:AraC-like DNA-binding protein